MAEHRGAPFASRVPQPIAPVQLRGTKQVAGSEVAETLNVLASQLLPAIRGEHIENLQQEVKLEAANVKKFLKLVRNPELLTSAFGVDAIENPVVRQTLRSFAEVREATKQGILPGQFALERLEVIQNNAIRDAPEFEKEIRQAMIAATGQDPSKTIFAQLLKEPPLTASQKTEAKIQEQMTLAGASREAVIAAGRATFLRQFQSDQFEINKLSGLVTLSSLSQEATATAGGIYGEMLVAIQQENVRVGGLTPLFASQVLTGVRMQVVRARAKLSAGLKGQFADPADLAAALAPLEKFQQDMEFIVKNNLLETLISDTNSLNRAVITGEFMKNADDAAAITLGGGKLYLEFKKFFNEKNRPELAALQQKLFTRAESAAAIKNVTRGAQLFPLPNEPGVMNQFIRMNDDDFSTLTPQEKNDRRLAANIVLRTPEASPEARAGANKTLLKDHTYAWRAYSNEKVIASALVNEDMAKVFVSLQTNQTAGLAREYTDIVTNLNGFNSNRFSIVEGALVYKLSATLAKNKTAADREVPLFVDRFNQANSISRRYAEVGLLSEIKYGGVEKYFNTIQTAVARTQAPTDVPLVEPPSATIEVIFDTDGNLIFKE